MIPGLRLPTDRSLLLLAAALAASLLACGPRSEPATSRACVDCAVVFDFIEEFPLADPRVPTRLVDFDSPEARRRMVSGWSLRAAADGRARAVCGGIGEESVLDVWIADPKPDRLTFRGKPVRGGEGRVHRVTVAVNGSTVATLELDREMEVYEVEVPAEAWVPGENRIALRYAPREATAHSTRTDRRSQPVMAWDWIRLSGDDPPRAPAPGAPPARELVLPAGTRLDYHLDAAPGSVLAIERIEARGPGGDTRAPGEDPGLRIEIESPDALRRMDVDASAADGPARVEIPLDAEGPLRIGLAARAGRGVRIEAPVLLAPAGELPDVAAVPPAERVDMPNIVLFMVDTLRADHLGSYGYALPTSPRIDAFAEEATLFTRFQAQSPWTRPSVASIFTGLIGQAHQANHRNAALSEEAVTLAELLREAGYQTAGFALNSNIDRKLGMGQGFQVYRIGGGLPLLEEEAYAWLARRPPNRRFFLYLHHMDPHVPYAPREPYRRTFAPGVDLERGRLEVMQGLVSGQTRLDDPAEIEAMRRDLVALYDAEVASVDERFGRLVDHLKELGLYDDTLVLFVADHGEEFFEHGWWAHGKTLYAEQLRVPFVAKFPRGWGAGRRVDSLAQHIDVLPTLLDYLGRDVPEFVQGRSLLPAVSGVERHDRPALAFVDVNGRTAESVVDGAGRWKLIRYTHYDRPRPVVELYDLANDPGEERDLADAQPVIVGHLRTVLERAARDSAGRLEADPTVLDEDMEARLRALGYVGE
ncbi:MAG: sulfatase [Myxococcota bacterium]